MTEVKYLDKTGLGTVWTKVKALTANFITKSVDDLVNYYLKSETYTKAEVNSLIGAIHQFHYEVYASLSDVTEPSGSVLYLIGPSGSGSDQYEEYVYDSTKASPWVKIGDTSIDLSGYVTTSALNTALAAYTTTADLATLLAAKMNTVPSATEGHLAKFNASGQVVDGGDTADYAKNLVAPVVQNDAEFVYRKTGGNLAVDGAGGAVLQKIKGKTLVWNQKFTGADITQYEGLTIVNNQDGSYTINGTNSFSYSCDLLALNISSFGGHKCLIKGSPSGSSENSAYIRVWASGTSIFDEGEIVTVESYDFLYIRVGAGGTVSNMVFKPQIFDLTLMFGAGNEPSTVEEFEAMFHLPYYEYNAGTLISNDASAIETDGFNQWDEEWELGTIDLGTGMPSFADGYFRSKNYIHLPKDSAIYLFSGTDDNIYLFFYDSNKNYIGYYPSSSGEIARADNVEYIKFVDVTRNVYNHDICINLSDPSRNGTYEPYWKSQVQLNLDDFYVKDPSGGADIHITGGLKSAGSVYDEIVGNKYIKRVGEVDLGTKSYSKQINCFMSNSGVNDMADKRTPAMVCGRYTYADSNSIWDGDAGDKVIGNAYVVSSETTRIMIYDSALASLSADDFKTQVSGIMLYYELATPIEYELVTVPDYTYPVDGDGTERRLPEDTASSVHAPFRADILYALNGSATLRNLDANYVRNDNIKQDTGNNENTVMSQAAVTRELGILSQRIAMTDLSFIDPETGVGLFKRNTSNWYIVRAAGNYMFPLVYGNAVKNGLPNKAAYTRLGSTYTADFVNHLGNPVTDPFIERNAGCNPFSAELVWQTGQGLITAVNLIQGADCKYIQFSVSEIPANNGLACIAVKDTYGDTMWSWVIQLTTDILAAEEYTNHTGVKYLLMPQNLGTIWSDRANSKCFSALFQWGRKDAVGLPEAYNSGTPHALYDINGNAVTIGTYGVAGDADQGGTVRSVANSIQMPDRFFLYYDSQTYNWSNLSWMNNFWNAAITTESDLADNQTTAIKTIYDPCPVGYMLPAGRSFTGFTTTGGNSATASEFNVIGSFDAGWNFKKDAVDMVGGYYPASGYIDNGTGSINGVSINSYNWTFAQFGETGSRCLYLDSGNVNPQDSTRRANGFSIRPCKEY